MSRKAEYKWDLGCKMKKFEEIYKDIEKQIREQKYLPGQFLPTELELKEKYGVSRETLRKAQALLQENGFIQKKQGRGAIVLDINKFEIPAAGLNSFTEMSKNQGFSYETKVLKNKPEIITKELSRHLGVGPKTKIISVERLRILNGEALILDKDIFIADIVESLPDEVVKGSIYQYIEQTLNLEIGYANKRITVEPVSDEDRMLLSTRNDSHIIVIRSDVYLADTRLMQHHESHQRVDTFHFYDFARRK